MKLVVAVLLASTLVVSGCGLDNVLCQAGSSGDNTRCQSSSPSTGSTTRDDDDPTVGLVIVGAVVATAILAGIVYSSRGDAPAHVTAPPPPPQPVAVIAPGSDRDQLLQRMYVQGYLSASSGRCEATVAIGNRLAQMSPAYHDIYVGDPTIASCLRPATL